jgi:hypothetical protein
MQSLDESANDLENCAQSIEQAALVLLSQHSHFRGRTSNFEFEYREDVLVIRGCVPTFYLKQLVQTALKDVKGVALIDNQVDVVSSDGVSSVRPNMPR